MAGLSAAIEAADTAPGLPIHLLEADPAFLGGSAWWAQGATALPTAAQWPGTDPARARYRDQVRPDVLDWTADMGVPWRDLPPADGLALVAPAGGGRQLCEILWQQATARGVHIHLGAEVTDIRPAAAAGAAAGPLTVLTAQSSWEAGAVILATGGWAADLPGLRERLGISADIRLLNGAFPLADGDALRLGTALGGVAHQPASAVLYGHATPDPDAPERGLVLLGTERLLFLDATGAPQPWLASPRGDSGTRLLALPGARAWAVMDGPTLAMQQLMGSGVERRARARDIAPQVGLVAETLPALAAEMQVPVSALDSPLLAHGPYAALPLLPMTAKSTSGLVVDLEGRLLGGDGQPLPGLLVAGEAAGFQHPYEGAGGLLDSTMVAGAILSGRAAGRAAAAAAAAATATRRSPP